MKTFLNCSFKRRDYECTNIVAIRAEKLPKGYPDGVWLETNDAVLKSLTYLGALYRDGERVEQYGYL